MAEGGLNPEAPKPEPSPLAGQVPEADQQAIERAQDRIVDAIQEGGARSALEDLAGESAEQTTEQQKVEALFNRTREVNNQLGNELAHEVQLSDDSNTLLFKKTAVINYGRETAVYGVNSRDGLVGVTREAREQYLNPIEAPTVKVPATETGKLQSTDFYRVTRNEDVTEGWQQAFENSRDAALKNREVMERVRAERGKNLDQALSVVSEPIDVNAPPRQTIKVTLGLPKGLHS